MAGRKFRSILINPVDLPVSEFLKNGFRNFIRIPTVIYALPVALDHIAITAHVICMSDRNRIDI